MRKIILLLTAIMMILFVGLAQAGDREDIEALINEYNRLDDVGDMTAQAKLMTPDRIYIFPGGRYTSKANQDWNMKTQQAFIDRGKQLAPGNKSFTTAVDPVIRVYGTAAIASYIRYTTVVPESGPTPANAPLFVTLAMVKEGTVWKIALTHLSPLHPPAGN